MTKRVTRTSGRSIQSAFKPAALNASRGALLFGTALGVSIAVFSAMPNKALAANECGADTPGATSLNCGAGVYPTGITYAAVDDLTITLPNVTNVVGGVSVSGSGDLVVDAQNQSNIIGAAGVDAVSVISTAGLATVTVDDVAATGTGDGVVVDAPDGVTVNVTGNVQVQNGFGVVATSDNDITINVSASSTIQQTVGGGFDDAINAYSTGGSVTVNNDGTVIATGFGGDGINVSSNSSDVADIVTVVNTGDVSTDGAFAEGIYAEAFDAASVDINNSGPVTTLGFSADAVRGVADGEGSVTIVSSGSVTTSGAFSDGLNGISYGDGDVSVTNDVGGVVETSGFFAQGVRGQALDGDLNVSNDGSVTTNGAFSRGISVVSNSGTATTLINASNSGDITTYGFNSYGIGVNAQYGTVDVENSGTIYTYGDDSVGIGVTADEADVTVTNTLSGTIDTYGDDAIGIGVQATSGNVSVYNDGGIYTGFNDVGTLTYTGDDAHGIAVGAGEGDIYIENTGTITTLGDDAYGIIAIATDGDVEVVNSGDITTGDGVVGTGNGAFGIGAYSYFGDVDVRNNGGRVETYGDGAVGIGAGAGLLGPGGSTAPAVPANAGTAYVYNSGDVVTHGDAAFGIAATSYGYYNSVGPVGPFGGSYVYQSGEGSVTTYGDFSVGILAISAEGTVGVTNNGNITTFGDLAPGIVAGAVWGDVTVDGSGDITTSGDYSAGIAGLSAFGDVDISNSGEITTAGDTAPGIIGVSVYGDVSIDAGDVTTGDLVGGTGINSDGVDAFAFDGAVDITVSGDVYSTWGIGVYASAAGADPGEGTVQVTVDGSVYGYEHAIQVVSTEGTTIDNFGYIYAGEGFTIDVDGAAAVINNDGYLYGDLDLTDNTDTVNNSGYFYAEGNSYFGLQGVLEEDTFNNTGTVQVEGTVHFDGLEVFDNTGGLVSMVDGDTTDYFDLSDSIFVGGAGSSLALDVDGQAGLGAGAADFLLVGDATGETEVFVNPTSPGVLGQSIDIVTSLSNETGAEFVLGAKADAGFVEYGLVFDAATDTWSLLGLPDDEAFEVGRLGASAQSFWTRSADAWSARMQEIRDAKDAPNSRTEGWELWMQAHGGKQEVEATDSITTGLGSFTDDLSTTSDWRGFQVGADTYWNGALFGVTSGFVQQETSFDDSGNSFDLHGFNIGAYAGWTSGVFFVNGLLKADWYEVDTNFRTLPLLTSFDGSTWGMKGEAGFRFGGSGFFVEPLASLAWTDTDLDGFTSSAYGTEVRYGDTTGLEGRIGARVGGAWGGVVPYVGLYAVNEFDGENETSVITGPSSITYHDNAAGTYGKAEFGLTILDWMGLQGFVKGEADFGDVSGWNGRLGVRWRW